MSSNFFVPTLDKTARQSIVWTTHPQLGETWFGCAEGCVYKIYRSPSFAAAHPAHSGTAITLRDSMNAHVEWTLQWQENAGAPGLMRCTTPPCESGFEVLAEKAQELHKSRRISYEDIEKAPPGFIWRCPVCCIGASLEDNARFHMLSTGHGYPLLSVAPANTEDMTQLVVAWRGGELIGVFTSPGLAAKACTLPGACYAPIKTNVVLPDSFESLAPVVVTPDTEGGRVYEL